MNVRKASHSKLHCSQLRPIGSEENIGRSMESIVASSDGGDPARVVFDLGTEMLVPNNNTYISHSPNLTEDLSNRVAHTSTFTCSRQRPKYPPSSSMVVVCCPSSTSPIQFLIGTSSSEPLWRHITISSIIYFCKQDRSRIVQRCEPCHHYKLMLKYDQNRQCSNCEKLTGGSGWGSKLGELIPGS